MRFAAIHRIQSEDQSSKAARHAARISVLSVIIGCQIHHFEEFCIYIYIKTFAARYNRYYLWKDLGSPDLRPNEIEFWRNWRRLLSRSWGTFEGGRNLLTFNMASHVYR